MTFDSFVFSLLILPITLFFSNTILYDYNKIFTNVRVSHFSIFRNTKRLHRQKLVV
ncbi:hypothetical protein D920_02567 [Enterococcus faecalis 13-SD-W-01]|nr:hypothetical protein D920_02567 [Enterococcus faecalis 13-SD-W-01]